MIKRWRYRRLYRRLYWHYASKSDSAAIALQQADLAFFGLTFWTWEELDPCQSQDPC